MKKNVRRMLALLLGALLVFSLVGCWQSTDKVTPSTPASDPEPSKPYMPASAAELWKKVDVAMNSLTSVQCDGKLEAVYYYSGYELIMESTTLEIGAADANYSLVDTKLSCAELSMDDTIQGITAYYDGKLYMAVLEGDIDQKLCAPITKEEYLAFRDASLTSEVDVSACTNGEFTKNEDDSWSIVFSGYTKKTIDKMVEAMQLEGDALGAPIEDMEVTVTADANFYAQTVTMTLLFAEEEGAPVPEFTLTMVYSKHNEATFDPALLDIDDYKEVDDAHVLKKIVDGIQERQNATSGNFVLDIKTSTTYYGQTSSTKETDVVTYGKKNGAYYYAIEAEAGDIYMEMTYQNGTSTVTSDGETYSEQISNEDAKAVVDGLINSCKFDSRYVSNIEKQSEGIYLLTCDTIDLTLYSGILEASGIKVTSGEQIIKVFFKDGKLTKIDSKVRLEGKYNYNYIAMELSSVVDFEKEADYPEI